MKSKIKSATASQMTPEAKGELSKTIRALRTRLLEDFKSANESTYKYAIRRIDQAKLSEANATRRRRIEDWIAEQVRGEAGKKSKRTAEDFRRDIEKQAAYTLLNRMLILRLMEAMGLHRGDLVAKGWNSDAYKSFRYFSQEIVRGEDSEGYSTLLQMVFDDLAIDMPGLYGNAGISDLIPVPTKTLRAVIDAFAEPELESCWSDDMTLGWVYQYWNDPEREALDAKINDGGKIEPHEIASKTQMFTERYMVDWLLQNSLGPMWLAMCKKHGWTPLAESTGTLAALEQRRGEWRAKRDAGEVALTDLMPLYNDMEHRWAYYVPQEIPQDAIEHAPETVRKLKILDPAVGSGHFLVVAFDLLFALYREEAQHRRQQDEDTWSTKSIVESILEDNLHGIDLDPRAVQIAASALWLKSQSTCREAHPRRLNLVASNLQLASLPDSDPALVELRTVVEKETGMPGKLTDTIVQALRGADHLGSLLQIDKAVDEAITQHETALATRPVHYTRDLFGTPIENQQTIDFDAMATRQSLLEGLERFLKSHTSGEDLGLRTRGKQLAAGVRFMRMVKEGSYDLVVANPPYQGTSKLTTSQFIEKHYPLGKADLFATFLLRGLELAREGGLSAMLTLRNWMFIQQYSELRYYLLESFRLCGIGDFDRGAFEDIPDEVVSVAVSVLAKQKLASKSIKMLPTPRDDNSRDNQRTARKRSATLCHCGAGVFEPNSLKIVDGWPLAHFWSERELDRIRSTPTVSESCRIRQGLATGDDVRYLRRPWEPCITSLKLIRIDEDFQPSDLLGSFFVPYIKGAAGKSWFEPLDYVINWNINGLDKRLNHEFFGSKGGNGTPSIGDYFQGGVVFASIGSFFSARLHRYRSIFGSKGCTAFTDDLHKLCCVLNSSPSKMFVQDINPTIDFTIADILRVPFAKCPYSKQIFEKLDTAIAVHEACRETSVEFRCPGPSPWLRAQAWAQRAVDVDDQLSLPEYIEAADSELYINHLSFAVGVAMGRFGKEQQGILAPNAESDQQYLPHGVLYVDGSLDENDHRDSLGHNALSFFHSAWNDHSRKLKVQRTKREWFALDFFKDVHKEMYENRPIYFPISSRHRTFVALVNIHRWNTNTLRSVLADHLLGQSLPRIDGELEDLRKARAEGAKGSDTRFLQVQKWKEELDAFIALVKDCAEKGPPQTDDDCPKREVDARYDPNSNDGVMINSAALWPLLEPQWKDPKKWWKELAVANSKGNKDYDWSHLAMRYFPKRVDDKCHDDPSLGVAHGCLWKYHPAKAWAWELRLQDEIGPDFRIEEGSYRGDGGDTEHRDVYLRDHALEAIATIEKEALRRRKDVSDKIIPEMTILELGLWSAEPEACWDMETRIIKKQEFGFRLIAPDEPEARSKMLAVSTNSGYARQRLLDSLKPVPLFDFMNARIP